MEYFEILIESFILNVRLHRDQSIIDISMFDKYDILVTPNHGDLYNFFCCSKLFQGTNSGYDLPGNSL